MGHGRCDDARSCRALLLYSSLAACSCLLHPLTAPSSVSHSSPRARRRRDKMATELDYAPSAPFFHDPFQQDSDYGDFAQWPAMHYDSFDHAQSCLNPSALLQHSASFDQFSTDAGFSFDGSSLPYGADISQDSIKPSALWQQEQVCRLCLSLHASADTALSVPGPPAPAHICGRR